VKKSRFKVNRRRANQVFGALLEALDRNQFPYNFAEVPHLDSNFPNNVEFGGVEEAIFLFVVCFWMRGGIKSIAAFKALAKVHEERKELFCPAFIADHPEPNSLASDISDLLRACGLSYRSSATSPTSAPREWIEDLTKLHRFWQSDPRNLLLDATSIEEVYDRMLIRRTASGKFDANNCNGLLGFREKMVSMIVFFWADRGLLEQASFPVPVDFHVLRLAVACELVVLPEDWDGYESDWKQLADVVRTLTQSYCTKTGQSWLRLCDALWLLSGNVCHRHPDNTSIVGKYEARRTKIDPINFSWNSRWSQIYLNTCARCPAERWCVHAVPSAYYYRRGQLHIRGPRTKPPSGTFLPGF